jgi:hypothetical protein
MKKTFALLFFLLAINLYGQVFVIEDDDIRLPQPKEHKPLEETYDHFIFSSFIQTDIMLNGFGAFKTVLGEYNTDFMNRSWGLLMLGIGGTYKKWLAELSFGLSYNDDYNNDSLTVKFNKTKYGIDFGYNLVNSKRFIVTPKTSINWNKYRLINSGKEKVHLEEYVYNRDLDIRFNQLTGFIGLNISYKFYDMPYYAFWTAGLYGGYIFQFNEKPWIYSPDKRMINHNRIDLKHYSFGMRFSFNIG